jgi:hypothetical protein
MSTGETAPTRFSRDAQFNHNASGNVAGDTYSTNDTQQLMTQYEALFGPAGRDIKFDSQRNKRHQRWHLPDSLKGYNSFLTDRIDGLITDATNSPFTRNILPYFYLENPDAKIKWNVYSFDEGMASRVPYESAARVLTQTKSSQSGYAIRQGLAIAMEHNFLASEAGRENFKHQLTQLVGSIQLTNDLDVHIALLQAQSYEKTVSEKYYGTERTLQRTGKHYCDMFGIYNKIPNALDLLIEEARTKLKTWGSEPPTFLLCPSNLTLHMTMSPERTNYITNGPDGLRRLAQGPDLPAFRGLSIIHSQKFALEAGREPRNVLRRKVRVAEHYWLPHETGRSLDYTYEFYDQNSDSFKNFTKSDLIRKSGVESWIRDQWTAGFGAMEVKNKDFLDLDFRKCDVLVLRPNIEHEMLSVIIGRGGTQELGSTFWGQTELACYDDAQHGIWGMSYKYHERAIVTNERNLIRMFDIAFDGYNGGMSCDIMPWTSEGIGQFRRDTESIDGPYRGKSMVVLAFPTMKVKEQYLSLRILNVMPTPPNSPPHNEDPSEDNPRLDLERVLRKISATNPLSWNRPEKLLETLLLDNENELMKMEKFMHIRFNTANLNEREFTNGAGNGWATDALTNGSNYTGTVDIDRLRFDQPIVTARHFINAISLEVDHLFGITGKYFDSALTLYKYWMACLIIRYMLHNVYSNSSQEYERMYEQKTILENLLLAGQVDEGDLTRILLHIRTTTNINCQDLLEAMYYSGHTAANINYWNWMQFFYSDQNRPNMLASGDIPNPLILPTMFNPEQQCQVCVDSESTVPISDMDNYSLFRFLTRNMTKNVYSPEVDGSALYKAYCENLESMFNTQFNISPGENIRANTAQIPTLSYHGNMKVKQGSFVHEDIKCIGHLGNSYPGMASVREGRGVQTMNAPTSFVHIQ